MNNHFLKKKKVCLIVGLLGLFLPPALTLAQFGPPSGYENMMPPSGTPGGSGQFGPPANVDEMIKKGEDMQKKGDEMQKQGLNRMKKSVGSMRKAIGQMDKAIAGVQKAGYVVAPDIIESTNKARTAVDTIEKTSDLEEAQNAIDDFNSFIDVLDENIQGLNMLANFPRILKQADKTFDKLTKMFDKEKAKLAKSKLDLAETVNEVQSKIDALKTARKNSEDLAKQGQAEEAFTTLENDYFANIEDAFQSVGMLQAASNLSKAVKGIEKGITQAEKIADRLAKQGQDMTKPKAIIVQSKTKLDELKAILKTKNFEPETAVDKIDELNDLRDQFEAGIEEVTGQNLSGPDSPDFFNMKMPAMPKEMMNGFPKGEEGGSGFQKLEMNPE